MTETKFCRAAHLAYSRPKTGRVQWLDKIVMLAVLSIITRLAYAGAVYQTTDDWGAGFNGQITVTNPNAQTLSDWSLEFDFTHNLTSIWDATIVSHTQNHYVVKPVAWNNVIAARGKVSFGFGGTPGKVTAGPTNFVLKGTVGKTTTPTPAPKATPTPAKPGATPTPAKPGATPTPIPPAATGIAVTITETGQWDGGFGANLDIVNNGKTTINGWTLHLNFVPSIYSLWNGKLTNQGNAYNITPEAWDSVIAPGGKVTLGFDANGELALNSATAVTLNGINCTVKVVLDSGPGTGPAVSGINIGNNVDAKNTALEITVALGSSSFPLSLNNGSAGTFTVASNNPAVATAQIVSGRTLQVRGLKSGRTGLRIQETGSGSVRYVGVRVRDAGGKLPGLPSYLAIGSVSEDTDDHLNFWHDFGSGAKDRYVDARYIYLNGGPTYGWTTWTTTSGGRAISYIQESQKMGMMPIFVWYNIADGGESYYTNLQHVQTASYMQDYYKILTLMLNIIKTQSPDDPVGIILEPDFLGYLAQNSGKQASQISAQVSAAYDAGVLKAGIDPQFPNTVQGLVQSINYIISRDAPQAYFGWQMNLWASPAGGWTTPVPGTGIVHLTDTKGMAQGRPLIYNEAKAITEYYLKAGITSYGANFVSIDKYGLDATAAEGSAATDPVHSTWFWNADHWNNYLTFVRAMHETSNLPVVLWQLPVGHINSSQMINPYTGKLFPDLTHIDRQGEDSAPDFFFGDEFITSGQRFTFFSTNNGKDMAVSSSGDAIIWGEHLSNAAAVGVTMALFGAGTGGSTTNVGTPPSDNYWWIAKAQGYYDQTVPLSGP